jgi:chromosome segregation ATPase
MSIQELLTYVEELSFKTAMIGYDKDEVDIQLDKICDEIEAIVKEKDDEIAALRSGVPQAPVVVDLNQKEEAESPLERKIEVYGKRKDPVEMEEADGEDAGDDTETGRLQDQIRQLRGQLAASEEELSEAKKQLEQLQFEKDALDSRLAEVQEELEEADARAGEAEKFAQTAQEKIESLENREPQNKDEAYQLYMKNADLLCKQLAAVDEQKEAAFAEAKKEAEGIIEEAMADQDRILEEAKSEKDRIIQEAQSQADEINADARERLQKAEEEVEQIKEEGRLRKKQDEEDYQALLEKKESLISFMKDISTDIANLITKADQ